MSARFPFHHLPSYTLATLRANSPQSPRFAHSPLLSVSTLDLSSIPILPKAPDLRTCVLLSVFRSDWTRLLPRWFSAIPQFSLVLGTCDCTCTCTCTASLAIPQFSLVLVPFGNRTLRTAPGCLMAICKQNVPEEVCDMCLTNQKWVAQKVASVCKVQERVDLQSVLVHKSQMLSSNEKLQNQVTSNACL